MAAQKKKKKKTAETKPREDAGPVQVAEAAEVPAEAVSPPTRAVEFPVPETARLGTGPYATSEGHLRDELTRVDQLVRAQTFRWRSTLAAAKPEHMWGMVHVTDEEVSAYLRAPFLAPGELTPELAEVLGGYWQLAESLAEGIDRRRRRTRAGVTLRLDRLAQLYDLSRLELDVLLLCLLPQLDGRYRRLYGYLQDDASRTRPSVELVLEMVHPPSADVAAARAVFDAGAPLVAHRLLAVEGESEPLATRWLRLDERVAAYLLGRDEIDGRLRGIVSEPGGAVAFEDLVLEGDKRACLEALAAEWARRRRRGEAGFTIFLFGPYGSDRLTAARTLAAAGATPFLEARVASALASAEGWERIVELAFREAELRGAALYWTDCDQLLADEHARSWERLVAAAEGFAGLVFLASDRPWEPAGRFHRRGAFLRLDFPMPAHAERRELWRRHLPGADAFAKGVDRDALVEALTSGFQFTGGQMADAVATAWGEAVRRHPKAPRLDVEDIYEGCRRQSSRRLLTFGRRIEPRTELTFDDLVLPAANRRQLEELRGRIHHRSRVVSDLGFERRLLLGKGLVVLFTGSSGTGKTMAAELLAREQGVDLYKVDLSAVVSKYVGETEKNLARVFTEAEDANAVLFFDEADALFGKRGEVKDARDRWANLEINFLLQRVEEYAGVVILASNLRQNIDEAFLRRIQVIVDYPFPDADRRLRIWRGMFPAGLGRPDDEALERLAERFKISGGSIKNIVFDAAFRALDDAAGGEPPVITLEHLVLSSARELQKLGKPVTVREFGEEFHGWVREGILLESGRERGE